jgi:hypothetical protein
LLDGLPKAQWLLGDRDMMPTGSAMRCKKKGITPLHPRQKVTAKAHQIRQAPIQKP